MTATIRPMNKQDLTAIINIQKQTFTSDLCESLDVFINRYELFGEYFRVALVNDEIVGYMICFPWKLGETPVNNQHFPKILPELNSFYLHDITLLPEARGSGMAKKLISEAISQTLRLGYDKLSLVAVSQSGDYWDKNQFVVYPAISVEKNNALISNYGEGARLMVRSLSLKVDTIM